MSRPVGCKNLLPSERDKREMLKAIRERADAGDVTAAGFLLLMAEQRKRESVERG